MAQSSSLRGDASAAFQELADAFLTEVLDALPEVYVFAKDRQLRFVYCNAAFVTLMGFQEAAELIGLSDPDLSPAYLVEHYREDDDIVLAGRTITDRIELVRNVGGQYDWFTTTKLPVRQRGGVAVIGLVGVTRPLTKRDPLASEVLPLQAAVSMMSERYGDRLTVSDLASSAAMSPRAFSERFRQHFGMTPNRYLRRVRLLAASELLSNTDLPVGVIGTRVGYYDQSHFTNDFRRFMHMPPREYRARYRARAAPSSAGTAPTAATPPTAPSDSAP